MTTFDHFQQLTKSIKIQQVKFTD